MIVLGLNETHCATAAVLQDGRVVGCASEERFTRLKNDAGYPRLAIDALLAELELSPADIDLVALSGARAASRDWLNRVLHDEAYGREYYGVSWPSPRRALVKRVRKLGARFGLIDASRGKFGISQRERLGLVTGHLGLPTERIVCLDHHTCHAAAAYYGSGWHADGGYAEHAVVREDFAYAIPAAIGDGEASPLLCAGIIGYRALRRAAIQPGGRLGLYGFGASAHIAIQVARHLGCRVFVMTREEKHRRLAAALGAEWTGGATAAPPEPLDSAVLFAPAGELVPPALEALDRGGTLALAGIYLTDVPPLDYQRHLFYERTLRSVTANTRRDGEELLQIAAAIPIRPHTVPFRLEDANTALQQLKHDGFEGAAVLRVAG